jgi:peptide/nickel transport system permease protein
MGARETLIIVLLITIIRYIFAIPLAFFAHKNRFGAHYFLPCINGLLSYIPTIIIVILLVMLPPILTIDTRPYYIILIIALVEVGRAADMILLEMDELSKREYVLGGIAAGATPFRIFTAYILPFLYGRIFVYAISDLGKVMFLLGQLGFIGIFISQEFIQNEAGGFELINNSITWPMMLINAFQDIRGPIWIPFFSAFAMTFAIFTFNLFAEGLKKVFSKKVRYI